MEAAGRVASFLDLDQALTEIVGDAVELVGGDSGDVVLHDPERRVMRVVAVAGLSEGLVGFEFQPDEGVSSRVMAARRTIIVADYAQYRHRVRGLDRYGFRAVVSAPLVSRGDPIGALNVHTTDPEHGFTRDDARLLTAFADHAAVAIDNARRYENEARLARELARTNEELTRSLTLQRRLAEQILLGRGPEGVTRELARLLGRPVMVQDHLLRVIAGASPGNGSSWRELALDEDAAHDPEVGPLLARAEDTGRAVELPAGRRSPARWVSPIRSGPEGVAYLVLPTQEDLGALDHALIEVASTGVALELARLRARVEVERRLRGDVLAELLEGAFGTDDDIRARAALLGHDLSVPRALLLLDSPARGGPPPTGLLEVVETALEEHAPGTIVAVYQDLVVALIPEGGGNGSMASPAAVAEVLTDAVERAVRVRPAVILGEGCHETSDYAPAFRLARDGAEAARRLGRTGVIDARRLGVARLLVAASDKEELSAFARRTLGPLLRQGDQPRQLLQTLRSYMETGFNQRATARRCYVHINTVAYRLRRVETLLGTDLSDPDALLDLAFALRIAELSGLLEKHNGST